MAKETNKLIRDSFFILIFFYLCENRFRVNGKEIGIQSNLWFYKYHTCSLCMREQLLFFFFLSDNKGLMEVIENKVQGTDDTKGDTKERQLDGEFFMFFTECLDESLFIKLSWYKRTAKRKQCYFHSIVVHIRVTCYSSSRPRIKASSSRENGEMNK